MTRKRCSKCKKTKPATATYFSPDKRDKSGLQSRCKPCRAEYAKSIHQGRYDALICRQKLEALKASTKACVICGRKTKLFVDHCHARLKVRGMLCLTCNSGLGYFRDDPELLEFAAAYLRAWSG